MADVEDLDEMLVPDEMADLGVDLGGRERGAVVGPRVEGVVRLDDGRAIGFAEYGPAGGRPVLWFHGTPGARRQIPPAVRVGAATRDVRVIALERPGVGGSTPHLYDRILGWAVDVESVVDQLGIDRFALVGLSGGGPYVLACAYTMPDRVVSAGLIGSVAPSRGADAAEGGVVALAARFNPVLHALREPMGHALWGLVWALRPVVSPVYDLYARVCPPGDRAVFALPGMKEMFTDDLLSASRRQFRAVVYDIVLFGRDWGFSPRDVTVPIHFWHGDEDYIVPLAHGNHLAGLVPGAVLRVNAGGAHLANLGVGVEVLDVLLGDWPDD